MPMRNNIMPEKYNLVRRISEISLLDMA